MKSPAARTLMVQGTASGVGKTWLVTALCRLLRRRGHRVAPFKAQNMSNNAAVTVGGGEVGRAQALQAEAAGVEVDERMNPVLLKPISDRRSDVVLLGRSRPDLADIPWMERRAFLWPEVTRALDSLRAEFDWVVIEGAGSPAEVNLAASDIVNMAVARHAEAPVLLVADIDRGGAFASLVGTWTLLPPEDRARLRGFVLNRFRGDPALLGNASDIVRDVTGIPVLGVVPWVRFRLPEEDAATIERLPKGSRGSVGVVRFPRIANFDDVLPLEGEPGVGIEWVEGPSDLVGARAIVLPGSRNVTDDLRWLRATGLDVAMRERAAVGVPMLGICGGLQMLGATIDDPLGIEGGGAHDGLGLLPLDTLLARAKTVRRVRARWLAMNGHGGMLAGYEIHHGWTTSTGDAFMWDADDERRMLGYRRGPVWGTYVHGCLADPAFRRDWLGLGGVELQGTTPAASRDPIDAVADAVDASLDLGDLLA